VCMCVMCGKSGIRV